MTTSLSIPAAVLGFQGSLNCIFGAYGLLQPLAWRETLTEGLGGTISSAAGSTISLQLLNMGIFTILASTSRSLHRKGLLARIFVHLLSGFLFWREGPNLRNNALVETSFALMNAATLVFI